jgi:hypothetical protein
MVSGRGSVEIQCIAQGNVFWGATYMVRLQHVSVCATQTFVNVMYLQHEIHRAVIPLLSGINRAATYVNVSWHSMGTNAKARWRGRNTVHLMHPYAAARHAEGRLMSTDGEVANALVCKTSIHGFKSHSVLQITPDRSQLLHNRARWTRCSAMCCPQCDEAGRLLSSACGPM